MLPFYVHFLIIYICYVDDGIDYQKQLKQMLKDLAKEKDTKAEKELPKMSQVQDEL